MADSYDDLKMMEMLSQRAKPNPLQTIARAGQGFMAGMGGQVTEPKEDTTGRDLLKSIMLEKIKRSGQPSFEEKEQIKARYRTQKPNFNEDLKRTIAGDMTFGELETEYPTKSTQIEKIRKQKTPINIAPGFQFGSGSPVSHIRSKLSPTQAEVPDEKTLKVLRNIKSEADYEEFLKDMSDYQAAGVNVKTIQEYFGR